VQFWRACEIPNSGDQIELGLKAPNRRGRVGGECEEFLIQTPEKREDISKISDHK